MILVYSEHSIINTQLSERGTLVKFLFKDHLRVGAKVGTLYIVKLKKLNIITKFPCRRKLLQNDEYARRGDDENMHAYHTS